MNLVGRVRAAIGDHALFEPGEPVVVGVSGGPDSLALLHALRELAPEFGLQLHVAHLNHQLRGAESDADAAFVENLAREWSLPATVEARAVGAYAREHQLSLEEAARVVRYQFLADTAARIAAHRVAVAHNADDQVETILMHFLRGAGLSGLRGMTYRTKLPNEPNRPNVPNEPNGLWLVRPLLDVTREEIEAYCREVGLQPRFDRSNLDTTLFRNRLRREVLPFLEQLNPNLREVLRNSARALADDYEYLRAQTEGTFVRVARRANGAFVFDRAEWQALPPSLQRATLREAVRDLRQGLRNINWQHVEDARRVALEGETGAEATLPQGLLLVVGYDDFTVGETLPLPDMPLMHHEEIRLRVGETAELPDSDWSVQTSPIAPLSESERGRGRGNWTVVLDADRIRGQLVLRMRRRGERFEPSGLGGKHKSVHEFMIDEKIPRHLRDLLPILADEEKILWVCGYRVDERAKATEETKQVVRVEFFKGMDADKT
jgi:tRNA(Ile)-lysidine synthase